MSVLIGILVLFVAACVAAYFAARTWHWGHVILVLGIFLATTLFMILAAETLRINKVLRTKVNQREAEIAKVESLNKALAHGSKDAQVIGQLIGQEVKIPEGAEAMPGIPDLDHKLSLESRVRGRAWRNAANAGFNPQTQTVQTTLESPTPPGIEKGTILYLFEEGDPALPDATKGAQYLGEFRVTEATGQQIAMVPILHLDEFELRRIANSRGPWALYETVPIDRYELFRDLTEEQLRAWLPEKAVAEYIHHGQPPTRDDEEMRVQGFDDQGNPVEDLSKATSKTYTRRLRDYSVEFNEFARRRIILLADIAGVMKDNARLKEAFESAKKLEIFREDELRRLNIDLAGMKKERALIEKHLAAVQQQLKVAKQLLAESLAKNERLAQELASLQSQRQNQPTPPRSSQTPAQGPLALSAP